MSFTRITFLNAGHCGQFGYFAGRAKPGPTRFYAVFLLLEHERHGVHLIDTGYSDFFVEVTRKFPQKFYRLTTPVTLDRNAASIIESHDVRADDVQSIFISHFHGDHIAGLRNFPRAKFVYRKQAHESLMQQRVVKQVAHGFLAKLLPDDFEQRGIALDESAFTHETPRNTQPATRDAFESFRVHDYFGDGELLLVDLPGHSPGHLGFAMRTESQPYFYIADATWDMDAMLNGRPLPAPSRWLQHSSGIYTETQEKLRRFAADHRDWQMLACHCPRTQDHVDCL
jgi:glyoxylase-like metal-dependent hydrolase (beta-lactamase superfamily II)